MYFGDGYWGIDNILLKAQGPLTTNSQPLLAVSAQRYHIWRVTIASQESRVRVQAVATVACPEVHVAIALCLSGGLCVLMLEM